MLLAEIVATSERIRSTRKRTEKVALLAECARRFEAEEIAIGVAYLAGELGGAPLGVGWASVRDSEAVPAAESPELGLIEVDRRLAEIGGTSGPGSIRLRAERLGALLAKATGPEQSFLRRLLIGELRQGALRSLVLDAIAQASGLSGDAVRRAQMVANDLGAVATAALREGAAGLGKFRLTPFVPVEPMLAQTADTVAEAIARFGETAFEHKLDGARVQLHKRGSEVRLYSRGANEVTARVPELVEAASAWPVDELIADGEVIALGPDGGPLPFQTTMRRFGRKLEVEAMRKELPLSSFFFDCLQIGPNTLLGAPARERNAALVEAIPSGMRMPRIVTADPAEAQRFLDAALDDGQEGVMAKSLDAPYEAGSRGASWLKLKLVHTLDLVVLAVEWGSGRREGWLSNLHLGARDEVSGEFVMLGKTFKGLTDELLKWQTERFLGLETRREGHVVYVRPEQVVEIAFGGVQQSPHYPAGLALRFARVKRYRSDKIAAEADTLAAVRGLSG